MTDEELRRLFDTSAADTRRLIEESNAENRRLIEESAEETRRLLTGETRRMTDESAAETRRVLTGETRRMIDESAEETRRLLTGETRRMIDESAAETRRHMGVVVEELDHKIQLVSEVLNGKIDSLRGEMNERFDGVDRRFGDMEGLIKFSHGELDKRLRVLEGAGEN